MKSPDKFNLSKVKILLCANQPMVDFGPHARMFEVGIHSGEGRWHGVHAVSRQEHRGRVVIGYIIAKSGGFAVEVDRASNIRRLGAATRNPTKSRRWVPLRSTQPTATATGTIEMSVS
jgi:hypothetical protein